MRPEKKTGLELVRREPREVVVIPKKTPATSLRQRFSNAIGALFGREEVSHQTSIGSDPRLQPYPGISSEFEAGVSRILKARLSDACELDIGSIRQLAEDVANLLCSLVKKLKSAGRITSEDYDEVFLTLKTIVIEQAREAFDETARRKFIQQLDHSIMIGKVNHKLY